MSLFELIDRVEALNNQADLLAWELEQARGEGDSKKRLQIGDKMLDVVRLRRSLGEHIQMYEDLKGKEEGMILTEDSPSKSKARAGYVYMGRFKDQELWIKDKETQATAIERLAS